MATFEGAEELVSWGDNGTAACGNAYRREWEGSGRGRETQVGMEPVCEEEEASTSDVESALFWSCQFMVTHHRKITFPQCGYLGDV